MSRRPLDEEYINIDDSYDGQHDEETGKGGYSWEEEYKRSWDVLQEDAEGRLSSVVAQLQQQRKRRRLLKDTAIIQRGIIRHLFLVIDLSDAMNEKDLRPSRLELTLTYAQQFVIEFFDQNPISQLGIIVTRDGIAEKLTELSGNPSDHIRALKAKKNNETSGEPSLQNALQLARSSMVGVPSHGSKEILLIFGALTTCDPTDIYDTIDLLQKEMIRVNIVGLAAEVQICRVLSQKTKGSYGVILNEAHYKDLLFECVPPPAVTPNKNSSNLVMMGFPRKQTEDHATFCVCHSKLTTGGYICPRCRSKVCELPSDCDVCGLTLVSSPHLARSYHHLFPVDNFDEIRGGSGHASHCFSCLTPFEITDVASGQQQTQQFSCPKCKHEFCMDCDIFIHEVLHNCPGCWGSDPSEKVKAIEQSTGAVSVSS
ncbi:Ssl1-like-domain-containing protein [Radiomyces spectabilis]|uniref:Ssl1-like-domain-containing protein n=1 Tax=Radiomyces spectabilis TaxID=64574 RepID=UPI00221F37BA|nr:Ssl1-like-domain-containing protein [Radiomyces spectabilis]KAI8388121.1 Ssl1-like-domain-containing protein [Radiomyces spectabilis]